MKTRRLGGALLTLALVLTLAPAFTTGAKAAQATTVFVAGRNRQDGDGKYNCKQSGYTELTQSGTSKITHTYDTTERYAQFTTQDGKATLLLKNYEVNSNASYTPGSTNNEYEIYCAGDLQIIVEGTCRFAGNSFRTNCYGIYVSGDLTIMNSAGKDGSLSLEMGVGSGNSATDGTAAGIFCTGKLTIQNNTSGKLTVNAQARRSSGAGESSGVCTSQFDMTGGTLTATGNDVTDSAKSYGLNWKNFNIVLTGGTLTAQGKTSAVGGYGVSSNYRIFAPTVYTDTNFNGNSKQLVESINMSTAKYAEFNADTVDIRMNGWIYNKTTAKAPFYSNYNNQTPTITYSGKRADGQDYNNQSQCPTQAGNYTVTVSYSSPTSVQGSKNFTIAQQDVTVTGVIVQTKTYDGTVSANVLNAGTLNGAVGNPADSELKVQAGTATFADKNIGSNKSVTCTGWRLTGLLSYNYKLSAQPTATGTITAKPVTVTGIKATDRYYGAGNKTVSLTGGTVSGKVGSDDVSVSLTNAVGTMADDSVGTNKPVTVTGVALSGTDAGNYTLSTQPSGVTVTISAPPISVGSTGTVSNGKLSYTTANVPAGARLIAAWYDGGGKFLGCTVETNVQASGTIRVDTGTGYAYKLFLVNGTTYAPLCGAWDSKNP